MNESRSKTATVVAKKKAEIRYWQWFLFDCSEGSSVRAKENCLNALPKIETKTVSSSLPSLRMTLQIATDFNLSQAQLARRRRTDKYWPKQKHDLLCECFLFPFAYPKRPGPEPKKGEAGRLKAIIMKSLAENEENMFTESYVCCRAAMFATAEKFHIIMFIKLLRALLGAPESRTPAGRLSLFLFLRATA